jgi:hypothetical protein
MNKLMNFKNHLNSFLEGAEQAFVLFPQQDYIIPIRKDFQQDIAALCCDAALVAHDLRNELSKHVKNNSH